MIFKKINYKMCVVWLSIIYRLSFARLHFFKIVTMKHLQSKCHNHSFKLYLQQMDIDADELSQLIVKLFFDLEKKDAEESSPNLVLFKKFADR